MGTPDERRSNLSRARISALAGGVLGGVPVLASAPAFTPRSPPVQGTPVARRGFLVLAFFHASIDRLLNRGARVRCRPGGSSSSRVCGASGSADLQGDGQGPFDVR